MTKSVISAYETALRYPSYDILIRIAALFGVSSGYLLGNEAAQTLDVTGLSDEHVELVDVYKRQLQYDEKCADMHVGILPG